MAPHEACKTSCQSRPDFERYLRSLGEADPTWCYADNTRGVCLIHCLQLSRHALRHRPMPSMQIALDKMTKTANENWAHAEISFSSHLVSSIYQEELGSGNMRRVLVLEVSQYLEKYLWPGYLSISTPSAPSFEHVMSIIMMVNEKFREGVPPWVSQRMVTPSFEGLTFFLSTPSHASTPPTAKFSQTFSVIFWRFKQEGDLRGVP